jgi:hypothetical protein
MIVFHGYSRGFEGITAFDWIAEVGSTYSFDLSGPLFYYAALDKHDYRPSFSAVDFWRTFGLDRGCFSS